MINIIYNNFSLQSSSVITSEVDIYSAPKRLIQTERLAQYDGSVIVKQTYESKTFICSGNLIAATISDMEILQDSFKAAMNASKQNFDIDYAGGVRRFIATPQNVIITRNNGVNFAVWSVEFICESPVGMDTITSSLLDPTTITVSPTDTPISVDGSYKAEPVITASISTASGISTTNTVSISNGVDLTGISITRAWTIGDIIEINCMNHTTFVNSAAVPTTGTYPVWLPGAGTIRYVDDFTTRSVTLASTYTRRYL